MIYDKELDQWFLSEFHRDRCMRCQENGGFLEKRYILNELEEEATIRNFRIVQTEGTRQVSREVKHYSLQMIS